jgi:hypothetical protein
MRDAEQTRRAARERPRRAGDARDGEREREIPPGIINGEAVREGDRAAVARERELSGRERERDRRAGGREKEREIERKRRVRERKPLGLGFYVKKKVNGLVGSIRSPAS